MLHVPVWLPDRTIAVDPIAGRSASARRSDPTGRLRGLEDLPGRRDDAGCGSGRHAHRPGVQREGVRGPRARAGYAAIGNGNQVTAIIANVAKRTRARCLIAPARPVSWLAQL